MKNIPRVSSREIEVLKLLANGYTAKQIGAFLYISRTTVVSHCENLKKKLSAKNCPELIYKAFKHDLL
jgi:DNA-binding CsgD family transcriptional regulator